MTNLQLSDSVAAALAAQAAAHGLTVEAYLEKTLLQRPAQSAPRISVEELERLLDEEASRGPSPTGTFSRAELYRDHD